MTGPPDGKIVGRVLRIEKGSIHDGDGLRTVVFLMGCPLRCAWCASPESQGAIAGGAERAADNDRASFADCAAAVDGSSGAGAVDGSPGDCAAAVDGLGAGVDASSAASVGRAVAMTAEEVVREIAKDEIFYFHSGGGVTISGGEPLAQPEFTLAVLRGSKELGIGTAIETCAYGDYAPLGRLLPYTDVVYADVKLMDDARHASWTGASNRTILANVARLADEFPGKLRVRLPLVPGVNMDDASIRAAARFCAGLARIDFAELLPYHRLGLGTYRKLGMECRLSHAMPPSEAELARAKEVFAASAPGVRLVYGDR